MKKTKQLKRNIKEVIKFLWIDKTIVLSTIFISLFSIVAIISSSIFVGRVLNLLIESLDGGISNSELLKILYSSLILIFLYSVYWISNSCVLIFAIKLSYRSSSKIRHAVFEKLLSVPISYIDKNKAGELLSRATNDIDIMISNMVQITSSCFMSPIIIITSVITIFIFSPLLSVVSIVLMSLIFLVTFLVSKKAAPNFTKMQDKLGELNAISKEYIENKLPIYLFKKQSLANKKFKKINDEYAYQSYNAEYKIGMVWPILDILENIAYGIIYVIGFIFILKDVPHGGIKLDNGILLTFFVLIRIANGEIGNIARFASIYEKFIVCVNRVMEIVFEKDDINNGQIKLNDLDGDIVFKNVNFSYDGSKKIIDNLNLTIKKGQKVAIVGPTGSGKSTIINLLMRFYEIDSGIIEIGGYDIRKLDKDSYRKFISIVLQESSLFSESILTNIWYGDHYKPIDINKINHSIHEIGSKHFINLLPEQINTIIENTENISAGEMQLLALTRAHYSTSNFLILDEATATMDSKSEHYVQKGLLKLQKDKTSIVIAHRLSTIVNSDLIIVMNNGKIIEQGKHKDLMKLKGFYYNLHNSNLLEKEDL